jgi:hypothetical protein
MTEVRYIAWFGTKDEGPTSTDPSEWRNGAAIVMAISPSGAAIQQLLDQIRVTGEGPDHIVVGVSGGGLPAPVDFTLDVEWAPKVTVRRTP